MKNIKYILLSLSIISFTFTSCEDSDNLIDEVYETVGTDGFILRTINEPLGLIEIVDPEANSLDMTVEVQQGNGSETPDLKEVRMYFQFFLNAQLTEPVLTTGGAETQRVLFQTFTLSESYIGDNALPRFDISVLAEAIRGTLPEDAELPTNSFLQLSFEVESNEGIIYDASTVSGALAGGSYSSTPFQYRIRFRNNG